MSDQTSRKNQEVRARARALPRKGRASGRSISDDTVLQRVRKRAIRRQSCKRKALIRQNVQLLVRALRDELKLIEKASTVGGRACLGVNS